jgi:hypothetical protein
MLRKKQRVTEPRRFLSARDLAVRWNISLPNVYRMFGSELPVMRVGVGSVRVALDDVEAYERARLGRVPSLGSEARAA